MEFLIRQTAVEVVSTWEKMDAATRSTSKLVQDLVRKLENDAPTPAQELAATQAVVLRSLEEEKLKRTSAAEGSSDRDLTRGDLCDLLVSEMQKLASRMRTLRLETLERAARYSGCDGRSRVSL